MIIYPTYEAFIAWLADVLTSQEKDHLRVEAEKFLGEILAYMQSGLALDATPTEAAVERFLEAISE